MRNSNLNMARTLLVCGTLVLTGGPVVAQQSEQSQQSPWVLEGSAGIKTDYVFRGISRSDEDIAVFGGLDFVHDNGAYAGLSISTIEDRLGHDVELEGHAGYGFSTEAYDFDLRVAYDSFHGNGDSGGYFEAQGTISRDYGLAYVTGGLSFTPDDREFGDGRSIYGFAEAEIPIPLPKFPPMSVAIHLGYEDFENDFDKWDWYAALYTEIKGFELGIGYYDTNLGNFEGADARVMFSISRYF